MFRKIQILVFLLVAANAGIAQFGIQAITGMNYFQESNTTAAMAPANSVHYSIGPSYWFRLKTNRIEFNPSILFDVDKSAYNSNGGSEYLNEKNININFPISIYPLDLGNDCHCPTFNKNGRFFEKGFHFIFFPSLIFSDKTAENAGLKYSKSITEYQLGLGAGIDIGLNKKWTLSPELIIFKSFKDAYTAIPLELWLNNNTESRYRIDLGMRFTWYGKHNR